MVVGRRLFFRCFGVGFVQYHLVMTSTRIKICVHAACGQFHEQIMQAKGCYSSFLKLTSHQVAMSSLAMLEHTSHFHIILLLQLATINWNQFWRFLAHKRYGSRKIWTRCTSIFPQCRDKESGNSSQKRSSLMPNMAAQKRTIRSAKECTFSSPPISLLTVKVQQTFWPTLSHSPPRHKDTNTQGHIRKIAQDKYYLICQQESHSGSNLKLQQTALVQICPVQHPEFMLTFVFIP